MSTAIELRIDPRDRPVGRGRVRRLLPHRSRRMVGPFIFADVIGPDDLTPGSGIDVDAHPHIGLSTLTYLFAGRMVHRDSTGAVQTIEPGAVNWMTAGSGVTHTERSHPDDRSTHRRLHGLQTWVALPDPAEAVAPDLPARGRRRDPRRRGRRLDGPRGRRLGMVAGVAGAGILAARPRRRRHPAGVAGAGRGRALRGGGDLRRRRSHGGRRGRAGRTARRAPTRCSPRSSVGRRGRWCWGASPSVPVTSGGTSSTPIPTASSRPRTSGSRSDSRGSPTTTTPGSPCPGEDLWSVVVVREEGLEPSHPFGHRNLNPARLPIPPLARVCAGRVSPALWAHESVRGPGGGGWRRRRQPAG